MDKRGMVRICLCFLLLFGLMLAGCGSQKNGQKSSELVKCSDTSFDMFDTVTLISGYDTDEESFRKKTAVLFAALKEYHELYDIYHNYDGIANLKTINDNAGIAPVKVDERILDMLEYGISMYEITNEKTNIAMGSVLKIWHEHREQAELDPEGATLPDYSELEDAAQYMDLGQVEIDRDAGTVYLPDAGMRLDVGAVAKGYATDRLCDIAREHGWDNMVLSVGGNVKIVGEKPDGSGWRVGIQTPDSSWGSSYFCLLDLKDGSLVTSGSYQRFFTVDGKRYHHIIDPDSLMPENNFLSVSILCESSAMGDALSTALFCMTQEEGRHIIDSLDGVEAVWVYEDGSYVYTDGVEPYLIQ